MAPPLGGWLALLWAPAAGLYVLALFRSPARWPWCLVGGVSSLTALSFGALFTGWGCALRPCQDIVFETVVCAMYVGQCVVVVAVWPSALLLLLRDWERTPAFEDIDWIVLFAGAVALGLSLVYPSLGHVFDPMLWQMRAFVRSHALARGLVFSADAYGVLAVVCLAFGSVRILGRRLFLAAVRRGKIASWQLSTTLPPGQSVASLPALLRFAAKGSTEWLLFAPLDDEHPVVVASVSARTGLP